MSRAEEKGFRRCVAGTCFAVLILLGQVGCSSGAPKPDEVKAFRYLLSTDGIVALPHDAVIEKLTTTGFDTADYWAIIRIAPEKIAAFEQGIAKTSGSSIWELTATVPNASGDSSPPSWWAAAKPQQFKGWIIQTRPGQGGSFPRGYRFYIDAASGRVYVHRWNA